MGKLFVWFHLFHSNGKLFRWYCISNTTISPALTRTHVKWNSHCLTHSMLLFKWILFFAVCLYSIGPEASKWYYHDCLLHLLYLPLITIYSRSILCLTFDTIALEYMKFWKRLTFNNKYSIKHMTFWIFWRSSLSSLFSLVHKAGFPLICQQWILENIYRLTCQ